MIDSILCIHYMTITALILIPSVAVAIGEGMIGMHAITALDKQPHAHSDIIRTSFIGSALVETTAILGFFMAILLVLSNNHTIFETPYPYYAEIGIALALCLSGAAVGIVSAFSTQEACNAIARQPFFAQKILGFSIMTQALVQTPIIAGFIVAFLIKNQLPDVTCLADTLRLIASGLCVGFGGIGPAIGLAHFAKTACRAIGFNKDSYNNLLSFTLVSQALTETPVIFALVVSLLMLLTVPTLADDQLLRGIAMLAAGISTGLGTFGPGISSGRTAAAACKEIANNPDAHAALSRASMLGQALIETCILYAVLLSIALIFLTQ